MTTLVSEIPLPPKNGQISLSTHGLCSPWSSKNLIDRNQLKKFMPVCVDVTYMYTDFDGRGLSSFGDTTTSKNGQISLSIPMDYSPWSSKNLIDWNWLKKFMQVCVDVTCMYTNFGGCNLSGLGDTTTSQKRPNFPFDPWTIVHGHQKI